MMARKRGRISAGSLAVWQEDEDHCDASRSEARERTLILFAGLDKELFDVNPVIVGEGRQGAARTSSG